MRVRAFIEMIKDEYQGKQVVRKGELRQRWEWSPAVLEVAKHFDTRDDGSHRHDRAYEGVHAHDSRVPARPHWA